MKMFKNDSLIYTEEELSLRADRDTKNLKNIKDLNFSASNLLIL